MKHVAIIDSPSGAQAIVKQLEGYFTFSCVDGNNSLSSVTTNKFPDAVVINADYNSVKLIDTIKYLRGVPLLGNVPIILSTADNDVKRQEILCACGADDVLVMPLCRELIIRRISSLINAHPSKFSSVSNNVLKFDELIDFVSEKSVSRGALLVQHSDFANIYRFVLRSLERDKKSVQVLLFTLNSKYCNENEAAKNDVMNTLSDAIQICLRRGDISSICSKNQVVILLMDADDDGGHLVANRIISSFYSECDDEDYELHYDIREINVNDIKEKFIS